MDMMHLKKTIYRYVIDSHPLVSREYAHYLDTVSSGHRFYEKAKKALSLNWNYRICKKSPDKGLDQLLMPETDSCRLPSPKRLVAALMKYDVISFDVFDTLVFRAVEKPADVFRLLEGHWNCMEFAQKRVQAERDARKEKEEVTIDDIYRILAAETSIGRQEGISREICMEHRVNFSIKMGLLAQPGY